MFRIRRLHSTLLSILFLPPLLAGSSGPVVESVQAVAVADSGVRIAVEGSGFAPGATIWFGGTPLQTDRLSDTKLQATGPAEAAPGGWAAV